MDLSFSFLAGILAFLSPCIIPMITIYLGLITGMTAEEVITLSESGINRKNLLVSTLYFILGFSIVFTLAGGTAGFVGNFLREYQRLFDLVGGIVVILFGLRLSGLFKRFGGQFKIFPQLNLRQKINPTSGSAPTSSFLVGVFFAIVCSHCIGPLLYSLLIFAGAKGSAEAGMASLGLFSLGLAIPYLITAFAITPVLDNLKKIKEYLWLVSALSGALLIYFGFLMASGRFLSLSAFFTKILPYKFPGGM